MKKTFRPLIAAAAVIAALASCAKDIATEEILNPQETEGQRVITIAYDTDAETKTSQDYDWHRVHFVEGDQIKVMDNSGMETCTVHITDGSASFSTSLTGELTAVYPENCGKKIGRDQTITVFTEPPHFQDGTLGSGHIASATIANGSNKAVFHNETALLRVITPTGTTKLTITSLDESYDISDGKVTGGVSNEAKRSVVVGNGTKELGTCYVSIHPGAKIGRLSFDAGIATKTISSDVDTKAGVAYTISDENWTFSSTLPDGGTFRNFMKLLAGSLSNITGIQFYRNAFSPQGGIKIADKVYMSYAEGEISVKTSEMRYTANSDCSDMFNGCYNVVTIGGLQNVNTSSTTNMARMFSGCETLTNVNLTGAFSTGDVTNMADMFYNCSTLDSLDLSNFNTRKVKNMCYMFEWCEALKEVYLGENFVILDDCYLDETLFGCSATWYGTTEEMESFVRNLDEGYDYFTGSLKFAIDMGDCGWWSAWNVGASKPVDYGDYFAWGETKTKSFYDWSTYFDNPSGDGDTFIKYNTDGGKTVLEKSDDAAAMSWGGKWRMPNDDDWTALRTNCTWTWTYNYNKTGIRGKIVKSSNGNSIFLPAAGHLNGTDLIDDTKYGDYWSSSIFLSYSGRRLEFNWDGGSSWNSLKRFIGASVRPVSE